MKRVEEIKFAFPVLNLLITFGMLPALVFSNPVIATILLIIYSAIFIIFTFFKKNLLVSTIATVLLLILDLRFVILIIADIVLLMIHERIEKPLRDELSYPAFNDIIVRFKKINSKDYGELDQ